MSETVKSQTLRYSSSSTLITRPDHRRRKKRKRNTPHFEQRAAPWGAEKKQRGENLLLYTPLHNEARHLPNFKPRPQPELAKRHEREMGNVRGVLSVSSDFEFSLPLHYPITTSSPQTINWRVGFLHDLASHTTRPLRGNDLPIYDLAPPGPPSSSIVASVPSLPIGSPAVDVRGSRFVSTISCCCSWRSGER